MFKKIIYTQFFYYFYDYYSYYYYYCFVCINLALYNLYLVDYKVYNENHKWLAEVPAVDWVAYNNEIK